MNIILKGPSTPAEEKALGKDIAKIHAECVSYILEGLTCPSFQKKLLLERIRKNCSDNS